MPEDNDARARLDLLWGGTQRSGRGPKPKLSLDHIIRTAIKIADTEGIEAVSMQRLASALGYTTMSLYRYVPSKDALIEVMIDTAAGQPAPYTGPPDDWRGELEAWTYSIWQTYMEHPWLTKANVTAPPTGPNNLAWFEAAIGPLSRAGVAGTDLISATLFLLGAVRGLAQIAVGVAGSRTSRGITAAEAAGSYEATLRELVDPQRFPHLSALIGEGTFTPDGEADENVDLDLQYGLQRMLDGIENFGGRDSR
ncbi:TetR family transcriptional regulator [Prauserella marina]|uniref:DNA-binding transcriptional regulator, AcrR family n=1 Tax=Prauserella marina TaxID=530584 RepID=A0A222VPT1_9PSEU|nr:TetR/AcrR family transcriptional regulator [Prauserella marina]ASR35925.1 TetR family transcriptional regulator [Prauserella marina]PWV84147.1 TetR family transcriptional regulator [Prauserella marina]SDC29320.1 DNA-binding transcriptional regulator, AcrR family [Prauserella marina]